MLRNKLCTCMICLFCLAACEAPLRDRIQKMEAEIEVKGTDTQISAITKLYQEAATKAEATDTKEASAYLTKSGDLLLLRAHLASEASRDLLKVLALQVPNEYKAPAAALLANAYLRLREKNGVSYPDDVYTTKVKEMLLSNHEAVRQGLGLKRNHLIDQTKKIKHLDSALVFIDMLEGYALAQAGSNEKMRAELLFEAANVCRTIGNFGRANIIFQQVADNTADLEKAATSQFLMAYIFENDMQALPNAKEAYEAFLKLFPQHEMAKDAQFAIKHLGKSPEQLLENLGIK